MQDIPDDGFPRMGNMGRLYFGVTLCPSKFNHEASRSKIVMIAFCEGELTPLMIGINKLIGE